MQIKFLALVIATVLLSTFITPVFATYIGTRPNLMATELTVDPLPECTNAFQCNATFLAGNTVTFTGILTGNTGRFVPDAKINIYILTATDAQLLTSAITERDGTFKAAWKSQSMDKKVAGETALIFVNFIEAEIEGKNIRSGNFVDPDRMRVAYDNEPVQLSKKKTGSYTFVTPPLTVGHHQLIINPAKEGYNNRAGFITVQVSGFFGK